MSTLLGALLFLPSSKMNETEQFYNDKLGFISSKYLESNQPHICMARDMAQIILVQSKLESIIPNREQHGKGYDGYFVTNEVEELFLELKGNGVQIVKELCRTDYKNEEFVIEDNERRWIGIGIKRF